MTKRIFKLRNVVKMTVACLAVVAVISCKNSNPPINGEQSPIGQVGNSFSVISDISGIANNVSAQITSLEDGVSTISMSANINPVYLGMISSMSDVNVSGTAVEKNAKYRFTSEGIQSVYQEGNLTLVKYNAKVGDVYTMKRGAHTISREVTVVSKKDEFPWNGLLIKTIHVKETGRGVPGVDYVEYVFNHRFGLVATTVFFEDGSSEKFSFLSIATN